MFYSKRAGRHLDPTRLNITSTATHDPFVQMGGGHGAYTRLDVDPPVISLEQNFILNGELPKGGYSEFLHWSPTDR
jgi:hypothetical protein